MTTQTVVESARAIAQKIVLAQSEQKKFKDEVSVLKDELLELMNTNTAIDQYYDFNEGRVYLHTEDKYSVPSGLDQEVTAQVKDPTKLSQDLVESYLKNKLDLNKAGKKAIRNSEDPDLSSMIVVEQKQKIKVDLAEIK